MSKEDAEDVPEWDELLEKRRRPRGTWPKGLIWGFMVVGLGVTER